MSTMYYKILVVLIILLHIVNYGYCSDGTFNVAKQKQTYQSTKFDPNQQDIWTSEKAIDGIKTGNTHEDYCTHTLENEKQPWWAIDLGRVYKIVNISITTRNAHPERNRNLSIVGTKDTYLLNQTKTAQFCVERIDQIGKAVTETFKCTQQPMEARFVIINKAFDQKPILTLCEVEIIAECGNCLNSSCKPPNGTCELGCAAGWTGDTCYVNTTPTSTTTTELTTTKPTEPTKTKPTETTTTKPTEPTTTKPTTTTTEATIITITEPTTTTPTATITTSTPTTIKPTPITPTPTMTTVTFMSSMTSVISPQSTSFMTSKSGTTTTGSGSTNQQTTKRPTMKPVTDSSTESGGQTTIIIAAAVGAVVGIIAVVILVVIVLFIRRKRASMKQNNYADQRSKPTIAVTPVVAAHQTVIDEEIKSEEAAGYSNVEVSPTMVEVANIGTYVANIRKQNEAFREEYDSLPNAVFPWDQCDTEDLKPKNRYRNIYPYNNNRVILKKLGDNHLSTYINASFIKDYKGDVSYIAALGPTKFAIDDIWRMVWEQNVSLMVMATTLVEDQKINCEQYWPSKEMLHCGNITVALEEETDYHYYTKRVFKLTKNKDIRTVEHYQYTAWPDKSVPNHLPSLVKIRDIIKTYRENAETPILVHCSAGVGRTGTIIALDILLEQAAAENKIDIYKCVEKMRMQRTNLVQTLVQYIYLHDALNEILNVGSTVIPCDMLQSVIGSAEFDTKVNKEFEFLQANAPCFDDKDMELGKFENKDQNRDMNVIPADVLRVKLPSSPETYINAVYVQGFRKDLGSIATQIPLPNTSDVFWQMIYQLKCTSIVCLENDPEYKDWFQGKESQIVFDSLIITTTNIETSDTMTKYNVTVGKYTENEYANLTASQTVTQDSIEVTIIELIGWSDKDLNDRDIAQFLSVINNTQKDTKDKGINTVVCRNGATECGLYLASLWLLQMAEVEKEVDVFYVVKQIRKTRPQFIPNKEQYLFLHNIMKHHLGTRL